MSIKKREESQTLNLKGTQLEAIRSKEEDTAKGLGKPWVWEEMRE